MASTGYIFNELDELAKKFRRLSSMAKAESRVTGNSENKARQEGKARGYENAANLLEEEIERLRES